MHIEELILDGFKSYAQRTSITGWDSEFNAITGFNGSGKSNILDAICFVLGMENLRQVRASSLQDLVWKRGQAGINKATVSLVFTNTDKSKSPVGYADCPKITVTRQVVVGGKNKWMINGHVVQQKAVESLFHSVQLNINNPHFLILQGQITKVLNMKSSEILAMVEEAAGTRMYEDRKEKALLAMEKKEQKVQEISQVLSQVIHPKLSKLKQERAHYFEYQKIEVEIHRLKEQIQAFDWHLANENLQQHTCQLENAQLELESKKNAVKQLKKTTIPQLHRLIEASSKPHDEFVKLEEQVSILSENIARIEASIMQERKFVSDEQERLSQEHSSLEKAAKCLREKHTQERQLEASLKEDQLRMEQLTERISASSSNGQNVEQMKSALEASIAQSSEYIAKLSASLPTEQDSKQTMQKLKACEQEIAQESAWLASNKPKAESNQFLSNQRSSLLVEKNHLKEQIRKIESQIRSSNCSSLDFNYNAPKNFDKSQVLGALGSLVTPKEERFSAALEICAGGRLFNIVVRNENVASELLEKGCLQRRTTFIPLNKITPFSIPRAKVEAAKRKYEGFVDVASNLLNFDKEIAPAVEFAFGGSFVCSLRETASKIAFELGHRAITFEGDVYDPSGTLTGGSNNKSNSGQIFQHSLNLSTLASLKKNLASLEEKIASCSSQSDSLDSLVKELEIRNRNLQHLCQKRDALSKSLEESSNLAQSLKNERDKLAQKEKELSQISKSSLSDILGQDKKELSKLTGTLAKKKEQWQRIQVEIMQMTADNEERTAKLETAELEIQKRLEQIPILAQQLTEKETSLAQTKIAWEEERQRKELAERESKGHREALNEAERELLSLENDIVLLDKDCHQLKAKISQLQKDLNALTKPSSSTSSLEESNHQHSDCNVISSKETYIAAKKQLAHLQEKASQIPLDQQGKGIMEMIDSLEKKESKLNTMLKTVIKDKRKISQTILKLNKYKRESLARTIEQVDGDMSLIFGQILPGGAATRLLKSFKALAPEEGSGEEVDGLEIKVSLDSRKSWKNSLAELSGGQRSLVALSLILALLKHRPAPMYILDEVDAALDLDHTQNIGKLLKSEMFGGSQFVVVSLKDGMFENANCLFRTQLKDGVSVVQKVK